MKKFDFILIACLCFTSLKAQVVFKAVVPPEPVIAGESFQLQYILEDAEKAGTVMPPAFKNFSVITEPYIYTGTVSSPAGIKPLRNTIYTLVARRPGVFTLPAATVTVNGKTVYSNAVLLKVITREDAAKKPVRENGNSTANLTYVLLPGEDPYEKIRKNLFLKVLVDKRICYVGEPVVATFKLYSTLQSRSDIVKNPGFYGFTVYDMINLTDKLVNTENVNGQLFDVHTIRKVQLYPLQAGVFVIDPMELKNKVEFSRSAVNKKTEQEIVEGVLIKKDDEQPAEGTEVFETEISTEPVTVTVKAVPEKNRPESFAGATGRFSIIADIEKNVLARNEEGFLNITVHGAGNFIQLIPPVVQWPAGAEAFSPEIQDSLVKSHAPLSGKRVFRYGFVSTAAGRYTIPSVSISFFNPDSGTYKTTATAPVTFEISNEEKITTPIVKASDLTREQKGTRVWILIVAVAITVAMIGLYLRSKKRKVAPMPIIPKDIYSIEEAFSGTALLVMADDKSFYTSLHTSIWQFFTHHLHLSGSEMKKEKLLQILGEKGIDKQQVENIGALLAQCERGMFTSARLNEDKNQLLTTTKELLQKIENELL